MGGLIVDIAFMFSFTLVPGQGSGDKCSGLGAYLRRNGLYT